MVVSFDRGTPNIDPKIGLTKKRPLVLGSPKSQSRSQGLAFLFSDTQIVKDSSGCGLKLTGRTVNAGTRIQSGGNVVMTLINTPSPPPPQNLFCDPGLWKGGGLNNK